MLWSPSDAKDAATGGRTGKVYMDAYKLDGTQLWRIDMGYNIRAGQHDTQLNVADFDGDGSGELAVKYLLANGASSLVYELHIYEPQPDGGWTDHSLTEREIDALLSAAVEYRFDAAAGIATASVPGEDASYRLGDQDPNPVEDYALSFTGRTFYRYEDGSFTGVFGAGLCLQGLETLQYFATVTADVVYDGNGFSLEHLRLMEIGGV